MSNSNASVRKYCQSNEEAFSIITYLLLINIRIVLGILTSVRMIDPKATEPW